MSKITMVRQFTVDRTTWGVETMRNANGLMCCLGHHARACGATDDLIDYMGMPEYVVINAQNNEWEVDEEYFRVSSFALLKIIAHINDSNAPPAEKEVHLVKLFAKIGIVISFTGEFGPGNPHTNLKRLSTD